VADPTGRPPGTNPPPPGHPGPGFQPPPPQQPHPWPPGPPPGYRPPKRGGANPLLIVLVIVLAVGVLIAGGVVVFGMLGGDDESNADPAPRPTSSAPPTRPSAPTAPRKQAEPVEAALTQLGFDCFTTVTKPTKVRNCYHSTDGVDLTVNLQLDKEGLVGAAHVTGDLSADRRVSGISRFAEVTGRVAPLVVGDQDAEKLPEPADGRSDEATGAWGYAAANVSGPRADYRLIAKRYDLVLNDLRARMPAVDLRKALAGKGYMCDDRTCSINFPDEGTGYTSFSLVYNDIAWTATLNQMRTNEEQSKRLGLPRFKEVGSVAIGQTDNGELAAWLDEHWKKPTPQSADFGGLHVELRYAEPLGPSFKLTPARSW
jgi:hypothetical protein